MPASEFYLRAFVLNAIGLLLSLGLYCLEFGPTVRLQEYSAASGLVALVSYLLSRKVFARNGSIEERGDSTIDGTPIEKKMTQAVLFFPVAATVFMIATLAVATDPLATSGWILMPMAMQAGSHLEAVSRLGHP